MSKILITGGAGFIAFHLAQALQEAGHDVLGIDNYNKYYDTQLKWDRTKILEDKGIRVVNADLQDLETLHQIVSDYKPDCIMHLAAYAGVRHSMDYPMDYIQNNIVATQNLIEVCQDLGVEKVVYASTSCVMAGNPLPWKEDEPTGHQLNPYGYTKRTNECQFKTSKIMRTIGLRFFTVYGPWGRPDMALFKFADGILNHTPIDIYNYGDMKRDFTYVADIIQGIMLIIDRILGDEWNMTETMDEIYNIGCGTQVNLMDFVHEIEYNFGETAIKNYLPKHPADTQETWSDTTKLQKLGYKTTTQIKDGVAKFAEWYKEYYGYA